MHTLTHQDLRDLRANLFDAAHHVIDTLPPSSWHRDKSKRITASRVHSSQALALDVFGTMASLQSRHVVAEAWAHDMGLPEFGEVSFETEVVLPPSLLGERRSTQVDAAITGTAARALIECKFTETDGGACSQTVRRKDPDGSLVAQCNGTYTLQRRRLPDAMERCSLTAKGIRYWEYVPEVLTISAEVDHAPCPFVGGWYQWMRNMVAAAALARREEVPHSFIVAYADGPFAMADKVRAGDWQRFAALSTGSVALRTVSYQQLIAVGQRAVTGGDAAVLARLASWVDDKVRRAAQR
jgi:hypothetical protein